MTSDPLLQVFFEEADELLRVFEQGVLGLERAHPVCECLPQPLCVPGILQHQRALHIGVTVKP